MASENGGLIRLTGLWKNETKKGGAYLAGSFNPSLRLVIFPNDRKERENDPDFIAYLSPNERQESDGQKKRANDPF